MPMPILKPVSRFVSDVANVDPAFAERALQSRVGQRRVDENRVAIYARLMREGLWRLNGEAIIFSGSGHLLDGQHRLLAVVKSGVTLQMLVVHGVDDDVFGTIDQGKVRSTPDVLRIAGVGKYQTEIAGGAKLALYYQRHQSMQIAPDKKLSHGEVVEFVRQNEALWMEAAAAAKQGKACWRPVVITAFHFLTKARYAVEWDAFARDLRDGIDLKSDQPVRLLRERLIADKGARAQQPQHVVCAFVAKAWNAELTGRSLKVLKFLDTEPFPQIVC